MCSLVILFRPGHAWPVLIAANRDEHRARAALAPARHWPDRPEVVAGLDQEAGGAWLGINDHALMAAVMDRAGTLGPLPGKRSRGELVLEALDHAESNAAAEAMAELYPSAYRSFNLVVADPRAAYWIRHAGTEGVAVTPIAPGLHMLASTELDDLGHPRIAAYLPAFGAAPIPDPEQGDWSGWRALLTSREPPQGMDPEAAMFQACSDGVCTRSSALIALPAYPGFSGRPIWLHAESDPDPEIFRVIL